MDLRTALQLFDSALMLFVVGGLIKWHREWSEISLKVNTLWEEWERKRDAEIDAKALRSARAYARAKAAASEEE